MAVSRCGWDMGRPVILVPVVPRGTSQPSPYPSSARRARCAGEGDFGPVTTGRDPPGAGEGVCVSARVSRETSRPARTSRRNDGAAVAPHVHSPTRLHGCATVATGSCHVRNGSRCLPEWSVRGPFDVTPAHATASAQRDDVASSSLDSAQWERDRLARLTSTPGILCAP